MKHLVIDARAALPQIDGLGTYLREIAPRIAVAGERAGHFRTTLLVSPSVASSWRAAAPTATIELSAIRPMAVGQNFEIPQKLGALRPDLYFYPAHDPPLLLRTPFVFTIHDVTLFRMRHYFERLDRTKRAYLKVVTPMGLRRARAVLAVSDATRREVGAIFGDPLLSKIHVTPNGICVPPADERSPTALRDRLLYVGTDRPHKNLLRVIEAYGRARREAPDLPRLEIVGGMRTPDQLRQASRQAGVTDCVVLRGHVSEAELEACYARAVGLVFPSIAEGFGLPILEAMVRGVPVVTSRVSACAEVAGDAALLVNPFEVGEISAAIVRVCRDPELRAELVRKGRARASTYTWQRTATQTFDVINACLAGDDRGLRASTHVTAHGRD